MADNEFTDDLNSDAPSDDAVVDTNNGVQENAVENSTATENEPVIDSDGNLVVHGHIEAVDLQTEMKRAYLDYSMSVIVSRALPDVRDGMKPVHRRIIYAMFDGGYRPDRGYNKCSRVVGDVMGKYHPHGDAAIYDAMVRLVQNWSMRYPLIDGQGNFGSPGLEGAAAPRYTECKMAPLAMQLVRDIEKETVDFEPNYDGKNLEPSVLPARFPNLLANGSAGIAVGMATNIPPHNISELTEAVHWHLDHYDATRSELLEALLGIVKGPDFPTAATILGKKGIESAYRTGRGIITMRAKVVEEEIRGNRVQLVATELPYQVNPDKLAAKIKELVRDGKIEGISDMRDETSGRTGQRLVIVLKQSANPQVVLNNLYKHTQLQESFGANMLALVDGVPRTLSLDGFIRYWTKHQIEVIVRRTEYLLREAEERIHILNAYLKALDAIDEVIALIRASKDVDTAREGLKGLLNIDDVQARAILAMQLSRLAALERQKIVDEHAELEARIVDLNGILSSPERQRQIVGDEMDEVTSRYKDKRRTEILPDPGEFDIEDLLKEEEIVITMTREGYIKRTTADNYKTQHRGGRGVRGAKLKEGDVVEHFLVTSTHRTLLFFTNLGRMYKLKAYQIQDGSRGSKGQFVANLLQLMEGEKVQEIVDIGSFTDAEYIVFATKNGIVKKTPLTDLDSKIAASRGVIVLKLRDDDELISVSICNQSSEIFMVSKKGMATRFSLTNSMLRPMSRIAAGNKGQRYVDGDHLLKATVLNESDDLENIDLLVITENGYAKRSPVVDYRKTNRGSKGVKVANINEKTGNFIDMLIVTDADEILAVMQSGNIIKSEVGEIRRTGRASSGVIFAKFDEGDSIVSIAKNFVLDKGESDAESAKSDELSVDSETAEAAVVETSETAESVVK
ncbi:MAG: DNA gyrase subunit A [Bifidobacteriaceae bacterium]|jgi:DNA gyrase subunit A|nr:DNA gyrase subunit A [Bifidobacteriaceae bacterium]